MDKEREEKLEKNLEAFKIMSESISTQIKSLTDIPLKINEQLNQSLAPINNILESFNSWNEAISNKLKTTLEVIKKIQENHKEGKEIRGAIITDIIDLDELMEEIILKKYVKEEFHDEVTINMLNDEGFSSFLKLKVLIRSGLIDELKKNVETLLGIRNIIAHSKYRPTVQTVEILHKDKIKDLTTLKQKFDEIFTDVMEKLEKVSSNIK